ncbi:MAG: UxaA family hydrolase [Sphaerochaeta sp.]
MKKAIIIRDGDNVAVCLKPFSKGEDVEIDSKIITMKEDVPQGHKFAISPIPEGENIIKYGYPIGKATSSIEVGSHVHIHNVKTNLNENSDYHWDKDLADSMNGTWIEENRSSSVPTFEGFIRADGRAAIRNEVWIVPTVGCVNEISKRLEYWANDELKSGIFNDSIFSSVDGVRAWTHPYGCSQMGEDHASTRKILADLVRHPHAAGVLVIGLGCENNTIERFKEEIGDFDSDRVKFMVSQDFDDEVSEGKNLLKQLINYSASFKRESVPFSKLVVGMKCGGSDGLSGITANALIGRVSDRLVSEGASTILTEVPEMFGAEQILLSRCISKDVFNSAVGIITGFKDYYVKHDQVVYENPSPGNKAGGITTLEDKSIGCVQKGGKAPISAVLKYGDEIHSTGLQLLEGPGNDIVSTTVMAAAGANIILFSTGRGTPLGAPVPTVKIATNHEIATKKSNWIDFDSSYVLSDGFDKVTDDLVNYIKEVTEGKKTKNEINNYREIAIFKNGVTL